MTTAQLSTLLKAGAGSPTVRIAGVNGAAVTTYTAPANNAMRINITGSVPSGSWTIDGATISPGAVVNMFYYLGPGQSTSISTNAGSACVISANKVD